MELECSALVVGREDRWSASEDGRCSLTSGSEMGIVSGSQKVAENVRSYKVAGRGLRGIAMRAGVRVIPLLLCAFPSDRAAGLRSELSFRTKRSDSRPRGDAEECRANEQELATTRPRDADTSVLQAGKGKQHRTGDRDRENGSTTERPEGKWDMYV